MSEKVIETAEIKVTARGAVANKTRRERILHWTQPTIHPLCSYYIAPPEALPVPPYPFQPLRGRGIATLDRPGIFAEPPLPYYCH